MTTTTATKITWTKLKDETWGLRGADLKEGATVTVVKKSGETQTVTVGKVLWTGPDGVCLARVAPGAASSAKKTYRKRPFIPCGYPGCNSSYCDECDGEGRYGR
jgi:hypothetical protein